MFASTWLRCPATHKPIFCWAVCSPPKARTTKPLQNSTALGIRAIPACSAKKPSYSVQFIAMVRRFRSTGRWSSRTVMMRSFVTNMGSLSCISAYGDLAVVASENKQYDLTLKALQIRTKLLGDNPGTFFLRATALDHLRRYPEASENYRQFLAAANGKYPDEEWKARHRLIAIEKLK